ncbi:hypothetical protein MNBD_GAMMA12-2884 [hydrothermal vent metagenome]|uniref:Uncharacterized protein n=1 Tax=hydrothermal vent metagenome TaxID=652676 RepID=A0A3B0Y0I7_9ZZZZ
MQLSIKRLKFYVMLSQLFVAIVVMLFVSQKSFSVSVGERYLLIQKSLRDFKFVWRKKYNQATTRAQKNAVLSRLQKVLPEKISRLFKPWYGTRWAYEGTSTIPGSGSIACGYFVTTILRDSGLRINRVRMAQAASETMIRKLNGNKNIKRYRRKSIQHFIQQVKQWGAGLYVVGLDYHTGFILNKKNQVYFIHSSLYPPTTVVNEKAVDSLALQNSNYRVLGKLFSNSQSVRGWLFK